MNRCSVCPTNADGRYCSRPIPPVGPEGNDEHADILLLGAGPGKVENRTGIPYTGLAGDELTGLYLPLAGLRRDKVVIGNATLCWDGTDRTPPVKRVLACTREHLAELLERVDPVVVVLIGGVTQALCDKRIRLDVHHGIPQYTTLLDGMWEGWVVPMYEPALGMRDTSMMSKLIPDFKQLGEWMRGEWTLPTPDEEGTDYQVCETDNDLYRYVGYAGTKRLFPAQMACDTENHGDKLWSIQISHTPGTARLIRVNNREVMAAFQWWSNWADTEWLFHFAQHDLDELAKVGIAANKRRFRDTMQESYQLCYLPQGLKALVYRLFGHEMKSWEDVVWPASVAKVKEWLERGIAKEKTVQQVIITALTMGKCVTCGRRAKRYLPHAYAFESPKEQVCKHCGGNMSFEKIEYLPSALESILSHVLRHTTDTEDADKPYDPWKKLPEMWREGLRGKVATESEWERLIGEVGEMPVLGIGNVPEDEAVAYACADADYTLRLARKLEELRNDKRWQVDEQDYDD